MSNPNMIERWFIRLDDRLRPARGPDGRPLARYNPLDRNHLVSQLIGLGIFLLLLVAGLAVSSAFGLDKKGTAFLLVLVMYVGLPVLGFVLAFRWALRQGRTVAGAPSVDRNVETLAAESQPVSAIGGKGSVG
jgi:hypothetical protein